MDPGERPTDLSVTVTRGGLRSGRELNLGAFPDFTAGFAIEVDPQAATVTATAPSPAACRNSRLLKGNWNFASFKTFQLTEKSYSKMNAAHFVIAERVANIVVQKGAQRGPRAFHRSSLWPANA